MKHHVLMSWIHLCSSLLYGGHQTPDHLMLFDFKMPPALFLCWAQTFSRFHPQTALNHRKSPLTHRANTHTHRVETQVKVEALQGFFSLFCKHESEWGSFMLNNCGLHSTCVVTTRFTGVSDVALRFAWYKRAALNRRTYSHPGVD